MFQMLSRCICHLTQPLRTGQHSLGIRAHVGYLARLANSYVFLKISKLKMSEAKCGRKCSFHALCFSMSIVHIQSNPPERTKSFSTTWWLLQRVRRMSPSFHPKLVLQCDMFLVLSWMECDLVGRTSIGNMTKQPKWSGHIRWDFRWIPNFTDDVKPHITDSPKYLPQRPVLAPLLVNIPQL